MNHEKLMCYQALLALAQELATRMTRWPRGLGYLMDQLRRAMASTLLNLAEGNGRKRFGADRRRFFDIARGSIAEVAACLDLAHAFGLIEREEKDRYHSILKLSSLRINALP